MRTGLSIRVLGAAGLFTACAYAATIDFVTVSATVAGGVGGGGNTLTYDSLNGLTSQGAALPPSSITQSHSPNTGLLNQTAASVGVDATLVNGSQTYRSMGFASADLATGKLGVLASSTKISGPGAPVNGLGSGSATMRDQVTFLNSTGSGVPIDIFFTLTGSIDEGADPSVGETMRFCLGVACNLAGNTLIGPTFEYMFFHNSAFLPDGNYVQMPTSGWVSTTFTPGNDPTFGVFHGVYMVAAGESTVDLFARLTIDCRLDAACDFSHTGTLAFGLAPGVSFTSASSVLLQTTATPEPGTLGMLASGIALLGVFARRRRMRGR